VARTAGGLYIARVSSALYNRDILRLAASIPYHQRLDDAQASIEMRSPVCGSRIVVDLSLDAQGRVSALGLEVAACAFGQASTALMAGHTIGRSPQELAEARDSLAAYLAGRREDPGDWPGIAALAPARPLSARHKSILLAFEAVAQAAARAATESVR
jgi:NifU-like protein involved in Fe-S cluster formation